MRKNIMSFMQCILYIIFMSSSLLAQQSNVSNIEKIPNELIKTSVASQYAYKLIYSNFIREELLPLFYLLSRSNDNEKSQKNLDFFEEFWQNEKHTIFKLDNEKAKDIKEKIKLNELCFYTYYIPDNKKYDYIEITGLGIINKDKLEIYSVISYEVNPSTLTDVSSNSKKPRKLRKWNDFIKNEVVEDGFQELVDNKIIKDISIIDLSHKFLNVYPLSWRFIDFIETLFSTMKKEIISELKFAIQNNNLTITLFNIQGDLCNNYYSRMGLAEGYWDSINNFKDLYLYDILEYHDGKYVCKEIGFTNDDYKSKESIKLLMPINKNFIMDYF